jgi:AcrR family transcriptional regulator
MTKVIEMSQLAQQLPQAHPNRFDRRREKTRTDLLEAAKRVISAKGYHDTRIADIASEADVGLGTFYLHFKTKNEIFVELIERGAGELLAEIRAAKSGVGDVAGKLEVTIGTILEAAATNREIFRIVFGHGPAFLDLMVRIHEMFIDDLRADLEPRLGARADAVAHFTIGMLSQAISWQLERGGLSLEELKQAAVDFALGGMERAVAQPKH